MSTTCIIVLVIAALIIISAAVILIFVTKWSSRYWRDRWPEDQSRPREDK